MNLIQESQDTYDKIKKDCEESVKAKRLIINDVDSNIKLQKEVRLQKLASLNYYKEVLDSTLQDTVSTKESSRASNNKSQVRTLKMAMPSESRIVNITADANQASNHAVSGALALVAP